MRLIASALAATFAVCAIGYVSFFTALPANSAEACEITMPQVIEKLTAQKEQFAVVPETEMPKFLEQVRPIIGADMSGITGALILMRPHGVFFGIEREGCFSPAPIPLATVPGVGA